MVIKTCPVCHKQYTGAPAISRVDNATPICSQCGTKEALEYLGLNAEEQAKIMKTISESKGEK